MSSRAQVFLRWANKTAISKTANPGGGRIFIERYDNYCRPRRWSNVYRQCDNYCRPQRWSNIYRSRMYISFLKLNGICFHLFTLKSIFKSAMW